MTDPFAYLPGQHSCVGKLNGVIWATGREGGRGNIPTGLKDDKSGRWYPGGNIARGATSNGVEHGASSTLIGAPSLEIHFCPFTVSSDELRIFLMENEFPLVENEEMPGVEDAIPLVAIVAPAEVVMLLSWTCEMAPALGRKALEFMIFNLSLSVIIRYNARVVVRTLSITISTSCTVSKVFLMCFY